jgi:hypothetical protein
VQEHSKLWPDVSAVKLEAMYQLMLNKGTPSRPDSLKVSMGRPAKVQDASLKALALVGTKVSDIAAELDCTPRTVKNRLLLLGCTIVRGVIAQPSRSE